MRVLVQRVSEARVSVDDRVTGEIGPGMLVLVCAVGGDGEDEGEFLAGKIARLRIFEDANGKMNRSVLDAGGSALVVSQFTLAADTTRGNRPGFSYAAPPDEAKRLYEHFCERLRTEGVPVETGEFAAQMAVHLVNDGPVTIWYDTAERSRGTA